MNKISIYLLDNSGNVQYGLNWGQRENRDKNQSYLQLEPNVYKSDFFPKKGKYFIAETDSRETLILNRAQKESGTALQTPESNAILGLYLRKRLGLTSGEEITKDAITKYGRDSIACYKIDNLHYFIDFSNDENGCIHNIELYKRYAYLLFVKHNVILTGAPGTGKTFTAKAMAADIISDGKCDWNGLTEEQKKQVAFVQFHPSYDYTDFVEGLRPVSGGEFRRQDGAFKAFCKRAAIDSRERDDVKKISSKPYIFIIDEINRGELSKIFGELFYAIEPDYRGKAGMVQTQYNNLVEEDDVFKAGFYIPENVYIIGTMNDVDRGVEAMDFAIRRRFAWIEVTAEESAENMGITGLALEKMKALNTALIANGLSRAYCIGGAYFRKLENDDYDSLWKYHLEGIVYEYFRGEPDAEEKLQAVKKAYEEAKLPTTSKPIEETEAVPAE